MEPRLLSSHVKASTLFFTKKQCAMWWVFLPNSQGKLLVGACSGKTKNNTFHISLVGGFNPSEKILVNWDDYPQSMGK